MDILHTLEPCLRQSSQLTEKEMISMKEVGNVKDEETCLKGEVN